MLGCPWKNIPVLSTTSKQTTTLNHTLGQSRAYNYGLMHTHIILREEHRRVVTMRRHLKSNLHNHCSRNLAIFFFKNNCWTCCHPSKSVFCNCSKSTFLLLGYFLLTKGATLFENDSKCRILFFFNSGIFNQLWSY